ncbi:hypothetical protein JCM11641_001916 [Rhodosporidiobolus odoratus]
MSLFCSISGTQPLKPVISTKSGQVFEKDLILKALKDNDGKDPITGESMSEDDLVELKTAPGAPTAPPRAPTFTSVPSLLHTLQAEWDSTMLECLELRRQGAELRQELSHALYKEDAAMRVLARVTRERDEAREALASVKATLGPAFSTSAAGNGGDAAMEDVETAAPQDESGLSPEVRQKVEQTRDALSGTRKKRKPSPETATPADIKAYVQTATVPSLHTTKPPGVSALALAKDGEVLVTGGLDKDVIIYDRTTSKNIAKLKGHGKKVTSVLSSTTLTDAGIPTFVLSASLDKTLRFWTPAAATGKQVYGCASTLTLGGEVTDLSLHPSGTLALSSCTDGTWSLHDLSGESASTVVTGPLPEQTPSTAIAFHPDGHLFAVGGEDSKVSVVDLLSGKVAASFAGHSEEEGAGAIASLSFSENGYLLASAAKGSKEVKIWDLRKLANTASLSLGEEGSATSLSFDYSAQFLAVVGSDFRVYQHKTWELLVKSEENQAELTAVQWGKEGREVIAVGVDRNARVLSAPVAEEA